MTEKITSGAISRRRALSVIGIAALRIAVPSTVLTVSNVQAEQAPSPPAQIPTTTKQTGTERRQERRTRRVRRRMARRTGRKQRRQLRRTGTEKKT
jgi:hypothetical protein